jgi:hypothetical protein
MTGADTDAALAAASVDQLKLELANRYHIRPALISRAIRSAIIAGRAGATTRTGPHEGGRAPSADQQTDSNTTVTHPETT